jgi:hypothetical protein
MSASTRRKKNNAVTITQGKVTIVAEAESPNGGAVYADAITDLAVSGADRVIIKTKNESGGDGR